MSTWQTILRFWQSECCVNHILPVIKDEITLAVYIFIPCVSPNIHNTTSNAQDDKCHNDVINWKPFPRYWSFVQGIHRSPVNSPHKGQWRGASMFSLICAWINGCVNRKAGDLRRHRHHDDVIVMAQLITLCNVGDIWWPISWNTVDTTSMMGGSWGGDIIHTEPRCASDCTNTTNCTSSTLHKSPIFQPSQGRPTISALIYTPNKYNLLNTVCTTHNQYKIYAYSTHTINAIFAVFTDNIAIFTDNKIKNICRQWNKKYLHNTNITQYNIYTIWYYITKHNITIYITSPCLFFLWKARISR